MHLAFQVSSQRDQDLGVRFQSRMVTPANQNAARKVEVRRGVREKKVFGRTRG